MGVTILQWNVRKERACLTQALWSAYDVLAIQEPAAVGQVPTCPAACNFHLLYGGGRAAIYIHKRHPVASWESEAKEDWCRLTLGELTVYSVYSPCPQYRPWRSPLTTLGGIPPPAGPTVVCGDFNLHHPLWDPFERTHTEAQALFALAERWRLSLVTPCGEPTREAPGQRPSTIDLAWVSEAHGCPIATHEGVGDFVGSDHRPQILRALVTRPPPLLQDARAQFSWRLFNKNMAQELAVDLPTPGPMETEAEVVREVNKLVDGLTKIAELAAGRRARRPGYGGKRNQAWTNRVQDAHVKATAARRRYNRCPTDDAYQLYTEAAKTCRRELAHSSRRIWREGLEAASHVTSDLWRLERWARLRSHLPNEPPKIPALERDDAPPALSPPDKAHELAQRFFPRVVARPDALQGMAEHPPLDMAISVTDDDVVTALQHMAPWKTPGPDGFPIGFLRACGYPLAAILADIYDACIRLGVWPPAFKATVVTVMPKPGKTAAQKRLAGGWRPISLLSCLGKVLEWIIARRVTQAAENHNLLPEGQFGNRRGRSTEAATRFVVQAVRAAWKGGGTASLLQLDLKGAFDRVHHATLVETLRRYGYPPPLLRWLKGYLRDRTARLLVDGVLTPPTPIHAGVPQGSPLSPILFILFVASLYEDLRRAPGQLTVGFADDTNVVAFGRTEIECAHTLATVYDIAHDWADARGMVFEPAKSAVIHFKRKGPPSSTPVVLRGHTVAPQASGRFLGIWLDRRLSWAAHIQAVKGKLATQLNALTRLAASTWGCSVLRAREIYTKVVRSCMAYGAGVVHNPKKPTVAKALGKYQSQCLRTVLGAYKATPICALEVETYCPPLDLYFHKRLADFEQRMHASGLTAKLDQLSRDIVHKIKRRRRPRLQQPPVVIPGQYWAWAQQWGEQVGEQEQEQEQRQTPKWDSSEALLRDWRERWRKNVQGRPAWRGFALPGAFNLRPPGGGSPPPLAEGNGKNGETHTWLSTSGRRRLSGPSFVKLGPGRLGFENFFSFVKCLMLLRRFVLVGQAPKM